MSDIEKKLKDSAKQYSNTLEGYKNTALATYSRITTGALKYGNEMLNKTKIADAKTLISKYISYDNGRLTAVTDAPEALKKCVTDMANMKGEDLRKYVLNNANTIIAGTGLAEISSSELMKYPLMAVLSDMAEGTNINVEDLIKGTMKDNQLKVEELLTSNGGFDMSSLLDAYGLGESKYVTIAKNILDGNTSAVKSAITGSDISAVVALSEKLTAAQNEKYFSNIMSTVYSEGEKGKGLFNDYTFINELLSDQSLDSMGQRVLSDENNRAFIKNLKKEKEKIEANINAAKVELTETTNLLSYKGEVLDKIKLEDIDTALREKLSGTVPLTLQQTEIINMLKNSDVTSRNDYILRSRKRISSTLVSRPVVKQGCERQVIVEVISLTIQEKY